jgi:hypothetical protein
MMGKAVAEIGAKVVDRGDHAAPAVDEGDVIAAVSERRREVDAADACEKPVAGMDEDGVAVAGFTEL